MQRDLGHSNPKDDEGLKTLDLFEHVLPEDLQNKIVGDTARAMVRRRTSHKKELFTTVHWELSQSPRCGKHKMIGYTSFHVFFSFFSGSFFFLSHFRRFKYLLPCP